MRSEKKKRVQGHEDTSVSLHPLSFREAVRELADSPPAMPKPSRKTKSSAGSTPAERKRITRGRLPS